MSPVMRPEKRYETVTFLTNFRLVALKYYRWFSPVSENVGRDFKSDTKSLS